MDRLSDLLLPDPTPEEIVERAILTMETEFMKPLSELMHEAVIEYLEWTTWG